MRDRINALRTQFSDAMAERLGTDAFRFVESQKGMFSFLGLSPRQVIDLRERFAVYMLESSRVSIAGFNQVNLNNVCDAIAGVME